MDGGGEWLGVPPTHVHMHMPTHPHTCMHGKHGNFMQMATPIGFGQILGIPYDVICMCACMHVHVGGVHPLTTPHPPGGTPRIIQNSIGLELIEIFQFCLKI